MNTSVKQKYVWRKALRYSLPLAFGYFPAGITYGVFMVMADFPLWATIAFSFLVYSGSAQYAVTPLLMAGAGLPTILFTTFIINLRFAFYGIPLLGALPKSTFKKYYSIFSLTDEAFVILVMLSKNLVRNIMPYLCCLLHIYWVSATIIGYLVGGELIQYIPNFDFAIAALFTILVCSQCTTKNIFWPVALAIIAFFVANIVTPNYSLLTSVGICAVFIVFESKLPTRLKISSNKISATIIATILIILVAILYALNIQHESKLNVIPETLYQMPSTSVIIITIIGMTAVTFAIRASALFIPKQWAESRLLTAINFGLPISIMSILTLRCFHIEEFVLYNNTGFIAEIISAALVYITYKYSNSMLWGIVAGILSINFCLWFLNYLAF